MSNKKTKKIGKIIVITLSVAILFFLLLPFLEEDTNSAKNGEAKKAVPQIFTSNPLSELVRKVYAMFARNKRPEQNTQLAFASQENYLSGTLPTDPNAARFDITHEDQPGGSSAVNFSYGGEDIGFINEEGEWVLIQQTNPEMAERGMHEVNTTDKAYDKYVRLERASKYTGSVQNSALEIPDSKWARLWKPIKKLFGKEKGDSVSPKKTNTEQPFALANASAGLGKDREKRGNKYAKASKPELGGNMKFQLPTINGQPADVLKMLNPEAALDETAEELKETARKMLGKKDAEETEKIIEDKKNQKKKEVQEEIIQKMAEKAEAFGYQPLMAYTLETTECSGELTPFYQAPSSGPHTVCTDGKRPPDQNPEYQQLHNYFQENQVTIIPVLDRTKAGDNPVSHISDREQTATQAQQFVTAINECSTAEEQDKCIEQTNASSLNESYQKEALYRLTEALYYDAGCDKEDCVWISYDKSPLSKQINDMFENGAGLTPLSTFDQEKEDPVQKITTQVAKSDMDFWSVANIGVHYRPVPAKVFAEYVNKYDEEHNTPDGNPMTYVYAIGHAQGYGLYQDGINPLRIITPKPQEQTNGSSNPIIAADSYNADNHWDDESRGRSVLEDITYNATDRHDRQDQKAREMTSEVGQDMVENGVASDISKFDVTHLENLDQWNFSSDK